MRVELRARGVRYERGDVVDQKLLDVAALLGAGERGGGSRLLRVRRDCVDQPLLQICQILCALDDDARDPSGAEGR